MKTVLLLIAFISLIGVRLMPRFGRWKRPWLLFCIINLIAVAILYRGSLRLESEVVAIREYSSVARLDALGNPPGYGIGSDHVWNDDLTRSLRGMYTVDDDTIFMQRGTEAEQRYREVVQKFPRFPFGYYFLAMCLRERQDEEWHEHARRAVEIFKITTRIDGHHIHHDEFLNEVSA